MGTLNWEKISKECPWRHGDGPFCLGLPTGMLPVQCRKENCAMYFWLKRALNQKNSTDKKSCAYFHLMNQDKDDICPYCGKPLNDDF